MQNYHPVDVSLRLKKLSPGKKAVHKEKKLSDIEKHSQLEMRKNAIFFYQLITFHLPADQLYN